MKRCVSGIIGIAAMAIVAGCNGKRPQTVVTAAGEFVELPGMNVYIATTEVTQKLWENVMGDNPSCHKGETLPVENVSYEKCQRFITRLNENACGKYRLPTDEEWEYACRAGGDSDVEEIDEHAWYADNSDSKTHPGAQKAPNAWGIYDMIGNVWEWTASESGLPGNRGGCYYNRAEECMVSARYENHPGVHGGFLGLRLIMEK